MFSRFFIALVNLWCWLRNRLRRLQRRRVDYVKLELGGGLPEYMPQPSRLERFLGATAGLSLATLRQRLQRIAADPHNRGVVFVLKDFEPGWATAESIRYEIHQLREQGKQVVVYLPGAGIRGYYVACAADTIIMPPASSLQILGLLTEVTFVRDALAMLGIEAEVTAISPYKAGGDMFTRSDFSPESREQLERLLDQRYTMLLATLATGRRLTTEQMQYLIDKAPYTAPAARQAGLIDGVCYEDELDTYLTPEPTDEQSENTKPAKSAKVRLLNWNEATRALQIPYRTRHPRKVAVLSIDGTITTGDSRAVPVPLPLLGGKQAGSDTLIPLLQQVAKNKRIAALVLQIDSPGGDAFASDLIWQAACEVRREKPVVVSMGNVAASGGYYIATSAAAIVAQPTTLTGSIGVFALRPNIRGLLERFGVRPAVLSRGARARLYDATIPPSEDDRAVYRQLIEETYADFKERVCRGRSLSDEQLEPIAGGRVWSGAEALQHGLVDDLGGLPAAITHARRLAELPTDPTAPIIWLTANPGPRGLLSRLASARSSSGPDLTTLPVLLEELRQPRIMAALPWVLQE